jgi:hypothetical protein
MSVEQWRPVVGWEGYYEVSDHGRVRSVERLVRRKDGRTRAAPSRILGTPFAKTGGYPVVNLWRDNKGRVEKVHRLVLAAFVGPCPEGMEGCHNDGDPTNSHLDNLRWDTHSGNVQDTIGHGTNRLAARTHCDHGHEFTPENTIYRSDGRYRRCRACRREVCRANKARRRNREGATA